MFNVYMSRKASKNVRTSKLIQYDNFEHRYHRESRDDCFQLMGGQVATTKNTFALARSPQERGESSGGEKG